MTPLCVIEASMNYKPMAQFGDQQYGHLCHMSHKSVDDKGGYRTS